MREYASKHNVTIPKGSKKPQIVAILRKGNHFESEVKKMRRRKGGATTSRRAVASDVREILGHKGATKSRPVRRGDAGGKEVSAKEMADNIRRIMATPPKAKAKAKPETPKPATPKPPAKEKPMGRVKIPKGMVIEDGGKPRFVFNKPTYGLDQGGGGLGRVGKGQKPTLIKISGFSDDKYYFVGEVMDYDVEKENVGLFSKNDPKLDIYKPTNIRPTGKQGRALFKQKYKGKVIQNYPFSI
tara:strand:- start:488 stop:1213 length:726 start_codon:yes stop_codon:yes gene_type:complete